MLGLTSEKYPNFGPVPYVEQASETNPAYLHCVVSQTYLTDVDHKARESTGSSIYKLAEENPRDAYVRLERLFAKKFAKLFIDQSWEIGSPEEDGEQAYEALKTYVEENRAPDPDIDEIDVVISIWKRGSLLDRLKGRRSVSEEALRFHVEPQDLAAC